MTTALGAPASDGAVTTLVVTGEIDLDSAPQLRTALADCLAQSPGGIRIDMRDVAFCDCAGLNALLWARQRARSAGVRFGVAAPRAPIVDRLFELTATDLLLSETL